jgi:hypothetical protein
MTENVEKQSVAARVERLLTEVAPFVSLAQSGPVVAANHDDDYYKQQGQHPPYEAAAVEAAAVVLQHYHGDRFRNAIAALTCGAVAAVGPFKIETVSSLTEYGADSGLARLRVATYRAGDLQAPSLTAELALTPYHAVLVVRDPKSIIAIAQGAPIFNMAQVLI